MLFADMASFTSASEALGAERAYHLVRKIISIASTSIESHGGHVLEYAGDSVLAIFGRAGGPGERLAEGLRGGADAAAPRRRGG